MRIDEYEKIEEQIAEDYKYARLDTENMAELIQELQDIFKLTNSKKAELLIAVLKARQSSSINSSKELLGYGTKSLECAKELQDDYFIVAGHNILGTYYSAVENNLTAFDCYWSGLNYLQKNKEVFTDFLFRNLSCILQNNIGLCLLQENIMDEALTYFKKAVKGIDLETENGREIQIILLYYVNSLCCHYNLQEGETAVMVARQAMSYLQGKKKSHYLYNPILIWNFMIECKMGDAQRAEEYLEEIDQFDTYENCIPALTDFIELLMEEGKLESAYRYLEIFLNDATENNNLSGMLDGYKLKMDYCLKIENQIEYKKACVHVADLTIRRDKEMAQIRSESLRTYIHVMDQSNEQKKLQEAHDRLKQKSEYDELTGLPNRYKLTEFSTGVFDKAIREKIPLSVEIIDVDFFKQVNDNYGHLQGDICLKTIAREIKKSVSNLETEVCARYGGDEFVIVKMGRTNEIILEGMEQLRQAIMELAMPNEYSQAAKVVTISQGGVNGIPVAGDDLSSYLKQADDSLYKAKKASKNTVILKKIPGGA
ncbi:MAG: GGDEF domain-containing protein [Lachnospiraceae bacterium]